jgi:hypothetical protein
MNTLLVPETQHAAPDAPLFNSQSLAEAILDAFPSGSYAMTGLLRLLDIVATSAVPTAAVECRATDIGQSTLRGPACQHA